MTVRILGGHALDRLAELPDDSVHCCVTSPPYFGLRSYGTDPQSWGGDPAWRGDLGLEPSPELYIAHLVEVFREVRRVLRKDGTFWLNIGDSYNGSKSGNTEVHKNPRAVTNSFQKKLAATCKPKDLLGIPWMLAFALRADGWYLRSEIIWAKRAPMPESVRDRPTSAHEKVFLLTKSARYFYDAEAVKEMADGAHTHGANATSVPGRNDQGCDLGRVWGGDKRNMRNWWLLGPEPFPEAHFATFPTEIPRRAILAGTSERGVCPKCGAPWERVIESRADSRTPYATIGAGDKAKSCRNDGNVLQKVLREDGRGGDLATAQKMTIGWHPTCACDAGAPTPATVLDPFLGAGTTALVADQLGRDCIGIELNSSYAKMAERRIMRDAGMFAVIDVAASAPPLYAGPEEPKVAADGGDQGARR